MDPFFILPATCELCGNWLPGHSSACPRNGVHPSQWKFDFYEDSDESIVYKICFDKEESNEQTVDFN